MKRALSLFSMTLFVAAIALGQATTDKPAQKAVKETLTLKGYVVDQMCARGMLKKTNFMEKAAAHTQDCALEDHCAETGYGLFSDGKWYKFDEKGSKQAGELIQKSKREKGLYFEVSGKLAGDTFMVSSMKEAMAEAKPAVN